MIPIFVPVFGKNECELEKNIREAFESTKYLEFRVDLSLAAILEIKKPLRSLFPENAIVLFTNRSKEKVNNEGFDLINTDIEFIDETKLSAEKSVLSYHQYKHFSLPDIKQAIQTMQDCEARYYKLSVELPTPEDLLAFTEVVKGLPTEKWLLMGMGPMGEVSRILFATLGFGTFASTQGHVVASGQIDVQILKQLL